MTGRLRMQMAFLFVVAQFTVAMSSASADEVDTDWLATQDILMTSNDYLALVREHWPKVSQGNVQSMAIVYDAMNNCGHFKSAIQQADNIDKLDALLTDRAPEDVRFAKGMYYKCRLLVDHYDEFPGWDRLRLRAALAGDSRSRIYIAFAYYYQRDTSPREEVPFSPAEFLTGAMLDGDPLVFGMIAHVQPALRLRTDYSTVTTVAWGLLECRFRGDCDEPASLRAHCYFMMPDCVEAENAFDFWKIRAGGDVPYAEAERKATDLLAKIRERRFEELDLDLVW